MVNTGTFIPTGKLKSYLNPSPLVGFKAGYELYERLRIDIDLQIIPLLNSETFYIEDNNETFEAKADFYVSAGIQFARSYTLYQEYFFDVNFGASVGFLNTDQGYYSYDEEYDTESWVPYNIIAGDYTAGFTLRKMLDNRSSMGINVLYHLVPFQNSKILATESFGMNYLTVSLIYKF